MGIITKKNALITHIFVFVLTNFGNSGRNHTIHERSIDGPVSEKDYFQPFQLEKLPKSIILCRYPMRECL